MDKLAPRIARDLVWSWLLVVALIALMISPAVASEKDISAAFPNKLVKIEVEPDKESFKAEWAFTNPHELPMVVEQNAFS